VRPYDRSSPFPGADTRPLAASFPLSGRAYRLGRERPCQQIMNRPPTIRHAGRHRRGSLAVALWLALSTTVDRVVQRLLERFMWPREVILGPPPLQMEQQLWSRLHRRPGAADEGRHALAHCQSDALDKGGVQLSAQAQPSEC